MNCQKINVKKGSKSKDTTEVQKYLAYLGYYTDEIDGSCGNKTVSAIKSFQKANGLVVDGVFGSKSCGKSCINGCDISGTGLTLDIGTWKNMVTRYTKYVEDNKREPNICYTTKDNQYKYISNAKYKDIYQRYIQWKSLNKQEPSFVYINKGITESQPKISTTTNGVYTASPYYVSGSNLGQDTAYYCACNCIQQSLKKLGITGWSERTIAGYAGTTKNGTGHDGINKAIKTIAGKEGVTLKVTWKHFSDFGNDTTSRFKKYGEEMSKPNQALFVHDKYKYGQANGGRGYGHYEVMDIVNTNAKTCRVLNSLGSKRSNGSYYGYLETRSFSTFASWISHISQPSVCVIQKQ